MQTYDHGTFLIVLDCADLDRSAEFWCRALGYDRPFPQSGPYLQLVAQARGGVELLLQQVPETKSGKNRLHLDLRTPDLDTEVTRLVQLGATVITERAPPRARLALARPRGSRRQRVLRPATSEPTSPGPDLEDEAEPGPTIVAS